MQADGLQSLISTHLLTVLSSSKCDKFWHRLIKKTQRRGARQIDPSAEFILSGIEGLRTGWRRTYSVRWSETIERNEAYETFWSACHGFSIPMENIRSRSWRE